MAAVQTITTTTPRPIAPLFLLGLAGFLSQFDVTALTVALPSIRTSLQLDSAGGAWVIDTYSLAFAAALLPAGYLADGWGRRRILLSGLAVFGMASIACALATSGGWLCVARVVQGVGAALLTCATLALIAGTYARRDDRLWAFSWIGTIVGVAMLAGPAGGGALAESFGWPAIFWINPPICAALLAGCWLCLDEQRGERISHAGVGNVLLAVVAMVGIVWSLLEGPHRGWGSALIVAPAAVAILLLLVLKLQLSRLAAYEYVRPAFVSVCALAALLSIGYWATLVYLPLACSQWFGLDPASTGVLMLGATAPMLLLPRCGAPVAQRLGLGTLFACGLTAVVLGDALLWHTSAEPYLPEMLVGMLLAGSGTGLINAQLSGAFVGLAPPDWAGMASAAGITLRQLGYAVGIALLGAMENVVAPRLAGSFAAAGFAAAIGVFVALRMRYERGGSRRAAPA